GSSFSPPDTPGACLYLNDTGTGLMPNGAGVDLNNNEGDCQSQGGVFVPASLDLDTVTMAIYADPNSNNVSIEGSGWAGGVVDIIGSPGGDILVGVNTGIAGLPSTSGWQQIYSGMTVFMQCWGSNVINPMSVISAFLLKGAAAGAAVGVLFGWAVCMHNRSEERRVG